MSLWVVVAALCAAGAVGSFTWQLLNPRRAPGRRLGPYLEVSQSRMGGQLGLVPEPVFMSEATKRVLGPLASSLRARLTRLVRMKSPDDIAGQLRQAGAPFDIQTYRRSNLFWVLVVPVFLAIPGIILRSTILAVVLFLAGALLGSRRMGAHLRSLRRKRAARLRSDLPTVAVMLAAKTANTKSLVVAVREIARAGSGPVIQDLKRALQLIDGGYGARAAFELIGLEAVDPAATRIYRLLATATTGSIDLPGSLIELASELRARRREEVERTASKRQLAMNGPIVFVTMPVLFMFIIVPTVSFLHA